MIKPSCEFKTILLDILQISIIRFIDIKLLNDSIGNNSENSNWGGDGN